MKKKKAPKKAPTTRPQNKNLRPPFPPGVSGNPKGKRCGTLHWKTVFENEFKTGNYSQGEFAAAIIKRGMRGDMAAAKLAIERMAGKPETPFRLDTSQSGEGVLLGLFQTGAKICNAEKAEQEDENEKLN